MVFLHWLTSVSLSSSLCGLTVISSNVFGLAQNSLLAGSTVLLVQLARLMRPMGFCRRKNNQTKKLNTDTSGLKHCQNYLICIYFALISNAKCHQYSSIYLLLMMVSKPKDWENCQQALLATKSCSFFWTTFTLMCLISVDLLVFHHSMHILIFRYCILSLSQFYSGLSATIQHQKTEDTKLNMAHKYGKGHLSIQ